MKVGFKLQDKMFFNLKSQVLKNMIVKYELENFASFMLTLLNESIDHFINNNFHDEHFIVDEMD